VGPRRVVPFVRAEAWAAAQPADRWRKIHVKDGAKGPITVRAMMTPVRTREDGRVGPAEWLLVLRSIESDGGSGKLRGCEQIGFQKILLNGPLSVDQRVKTVGADR
jgi:hypothetical protein